MVQTSIDSLVYIVDDEFAVRDSLMLLIQSTGRVAKSFASAEEFLNAYCPDYPSCLILDVRMPGMSGLDLQQEMTKRHISLPIIFISGHAEIPDSAKAFRAGAVDFLEKPVDYNVLMDRIEEAIARDVAERKQRLDKLEIEKRFERLTAREKEVLKLITDNCSNKEVAKILEISHRTIDVHRARIMEKMEAENVGELLKMALQIDASKSSLH